MQGQVRRLGPAAAVQPLPLGGGDLGLAPGDLELVEGPGHLGLGLVHGELEVLRVDAGQLLAGGEEAAGLHLLGDPDDGAAHLGHEVDLPVGADRPLAADDDTGGARRGEDRLDQGNPVDRLLPGGRRAQAHQQQVCGHAGGQDRHRQEESHRLTHRS